MKWWMDTGDAQAPQMQKSSTVRKKTCTVLINPN